MERSGTDQTRRIEALVSPTLGDMGYTLVRVQILGDRQVRLQIMVDRVDGGAMTVDDCAVISKGLSPLLDLENVADRSFTLEISSPGIDRPLVSREDFERFAGFEIKAELSRPIGSRRRFRGKLLGHEADGDVVLVRLEGETARLPFDQICQAKLVMSDELLAAHAGQDN